VTSQQADQTVLACGAPPACPAGGRKRIQDATCPPDHLTRNDWIPTTL